MNFKDQDLPIFKKGNYVRIDSDFLTESLKAMRPIYDIQAKYGRNDTDTFINEVRDSLVGRLLGFDLVNQKKHGFDGKKLDEEVYLEVKQTSFTTSTWGGTFNDTNLEKAEAFKDLKTHLAVAIWDGMTELVAIVYGQNPAIGEYLEGRVRHVANSSTRSTQSISAKSLILLYGFKVIAPPNRTCKEIKELFFAKIPAMRTVPNDTFVEYDDFRQL